MEKYLKFGAVLLITALAFWLGMEVGLVTVKMTADIRQPLAATTGVFIGLIIVLLEIFYWNRDNHSTKTVVVLIVTAVFFLGILAILTPMTLLMWILTSLASLV